MTRAGANLLITSTYSKYFRWTLCLLREKKVTSLNIWFCSGELKFYSSLCRKFGSHTVWHFRNVRLISKMKNVSVYTLKFKKKELKFWNFISLNLLVYILFFPSFFECQNDRTKSIWYLLTTTNHCINFWFYNKNFFVLSSEILKVIGHLQTFCFKWIDFKPT